MNKITLLLLVLLPGLLIIGCEDQIAEDKLTGSNPDGNTVDVSSRITGFNASRSGGGASLTAYGDNLSGVEQVYVAGDFASNVVATSDSVSFMVPVSVPLGMQDLIFIFDGSERATASIEMVALPIVNWFDLQEGVQGDEITVYGNNFEFVEAAAIGGVSASVSNATNNSVVVTVPAGAQSGPIELVTEAGNGLSPYEFAVCDANPENWYCLPPLNGNGDFEDGTIGVIGEGGDIGGGSFTAGSPGAQWEIIESPGGAPGLGTKSLKVTINELQNNGTDSWRIQLVNNGPAFGDFDGYEVQPSRRFAILVKIWADQGGRLAAVNGGRRTPCCAGFAGGGETITLNQGWNVIE
ncbi:MAG: hypothetical protein P8X57_08760, partial [Cyclobacteriaceae bacterium]